MYNQLELINFIAKNAHKLDTVVILADDDRTPLQAIEYLSQSKDSLTWNIEITKYTLLVY